MPKACFEVFGNDGVMREPITLKYSAIRCTASRAVLVTFLGGTRADQSFRSGLSLLRRECLRRAAPACGTVPPRSYRDNTTLSLLARVLNDEEPPDQSLHHSDFSIFLTHSS